MANPVPITNVIAASLGRSARQLKLQPNWQKLAAALAGQAQDLETNVYAMIAGMALLSAQGTQLDNIGTILGAYRNGRNDATFLQWIQAQVLINKASGTIPQILAAFAAVGEVVGTLTEYPPAGFIYETGTYSGTTPQVLANLLGLMRAAGINAGFQWPTDIAANVFQMAGGNGPNLANQGWGGGNHTTITTGQNDPVGGTAALLFADDSTNNTHFVSGQASSSNLTSGTAYTVSLTLFPGTYAGTFTITFGVGADLVSLSGCNPSTGAFGSVAVLSGTGTISGASAVQTWAGWWTFSFVYTPSSTNVGSFQLWFGTYAVNYLGSGQNVLAYLPTAAAQFGGTVPGQGFSDTGAPTTGGQLEGVIGV